MLRLPSLAIISIFRQMVLILVLRKEHSVKS